MATPVTYEPENLDANQDDYNPENAVTSLATSDTQLDLRNLTVTAGVNITGVAAPPALGNHLILTNKEWVSYPITLVNLSASSSDGNRFDLGGVDIVLGFGSNQYASVTLEYLDELDGGLGGWQIISFEHPVTTFDSFDGGTFTWNKTPLAKTIFFYFFGGGGGGAGGAAPNRGGGGGAAGSYGELAMPAVMVPDSVDINVGLGGAAGAAGANGTDGGDTTISIGTDFLLTAPGGGGGKSATGLGGQRGSDASGNSVQPLNGHDGGLNAIGASTTISFHNTVAAGSGGGGGGNNNKGGYGDASNIRGIFAVDPDGPGHGGQAALHDDGNDGITRAIGEIAGGGGGGGGYGTGKGGAGGAPGGAGGGGGTDGANAGPGGDGADGRVVIITVS